MCSQVAIGVALTHRCLQLHVRDRLDTRAGVACNCINVAVLFIYGAQSAHAPAVIQLPLNESACSAHTLPHACACMHAHDCFMHAPELTRRALRLNRCGESIMNLPARPTPMIAVICTGGNPCMMVKCCKGYSFFSKNRMKEGTQVVQGVRTIRACALCVQVLGGHPPGDRVRAGAFLCT